MRPQAGAYALLKTEEFGGDEPYQHECLSRITTTLMFPNPAAGYVDADAPHLKNALEVGCQGAASCHRCVQLYHLAGMVRRTTSNQSPSRDSASALNQSLASAAISALNCTLAGRASG